jgi:hypothetical protein
MQSLLASLGSSMEEARAEPSDATSTPASGDASSVKQTTKSGSAETAMGAKLSLAAAEIGLSSARPTAGMARATTATTKEKQPEAESKKESVKEACTVSSVPLAATEAVVTDITSGLIPAAVVTPTQPVPADLSSSDPDPELPSGIATTSFASYTSSIEVRRPVPATSQATAQVYRDQAADGSQTSAKEMELPPSVSRHELPSPAVSQTRLPDTGHAVAASQGDFKNGQQVDATGQGDLKNVEQVGAANQDDLKNVRQVDATSQTSLPDTGHAVAASQGDPKNVEQVVAASQADLKNVRQANATVAVATRDASAVAATRGVSANPPGKTVQNQSLSVLAVSSQIVAEPTAVEGRSLTLNYASSQEPSAAIKQSRDVIPMQALKPMDASSPTLVNGDGTDRLAGAASTVAVQSEQALPVGQVAGKPSTSVGAKSSVVGGSRSSREAGKSDSELKIRRLVDGQASNSTSETLEMAREAAGAHGSVRPAGELAQTSTTRAAGADSREAFAELDAQDMTGKPTWIHAGTQRAEAGFQDPALGWVSVRADASGGGVHAQLVPGSADAAQTLGGHLAGLNAYLTEHHAPVETLTVSAPDGGWTGTGNEQSQGQNMQQGAGQQTRQDADSGSQSNPSGNPMTPQTASEAVVFQRGLDGGAEAAGAGGVHISVMA